MEELESGTTEDDLVIGYSDVIEELTPELSRVMTDNSEAVRGLPGERFVQVSGDEK
jgi:hypothetical protein